MAKFGKFNLEVTKFHFIKLSKFWPNARSLCLESPNFLQLAKLYTKSRNFGQVLLHKNRPNAWYLVQTVYNKHIMMKCQETNFVGSMVLKLFLCKGETVHNKI